MADASQPSVPRALSAQQRRVLALMEIDVYQLRTQPVQASGTCPPADDPLARAIARAAGHATVADWCAAWLAAGQALPDLTELRALPAAKRSLWQRMRGRPPG